MGSAGGDSGKYHPQGLDIVGRDGGWSDVLCHGPMEFSKQIGLIGVEHWEELDIMGFAAGVGKGDLVFLEPDDAIGAFDTPVAIPRRVSGLGAPGSAVGGDSAVGKVEGESSRGIATKPAPRRIPTETSHVIRGVAGEEAQEIEVMNGHVDNQWIVHDITEATEVRTAEKLDVYRANLTEVAGGEHMSQCLGSWPVAVVLGDHMELMGLDGSSDDVLGGFRRIGEGFLG